MGTLTVLQPAVPFESLPKRQREFVEEYAKTGDAKKAYLAVGYRDSHTATNKARELKLQLTPYIAERVRARAASNEMAILGLAVLEELALGADSEAVRLNAAKELLSRTIPEAPKEVVHNHTHQHSLSQMSQADLRKLKERMARELGFLDAIDVTPELIEHDESD